MSLLLNCLVVIFYLTAMVNYFKGETLVAVFWMLWVLCLVCMH